MLKRLLLEFTGLAAMGAIYGRCCSFMAIRIQLSPIMSLWTRTAVSPRPHRRHPRRNPFNRRHARAENWPGSGPVHQGNERP
jgi:hypothetical protein